MHELLGADEHLERALVLTLLEGLGARLRSGAGRGALGARFGKSDARGTREKGSAQDETTTQAN
jgi:hypothetical protein